MRLFPSNIQRYWLPGEGLGTPDCIFRFPASDPKSDLHYQRYKEH